MNEIFQLVEERERITRDLENALRKAANLNEKSTDAARRLRKALLQVGFPARMIPGSIDPGYTETRHREFIKSLLDGTRADSLIDEAVKHHATIKSRIVKGGIA